MLGSNGVMPMERFVAPVAPLTCRSTKPMPRMSRNWPGAALRADGPECQQECPEEEVPHVAEAAGEQRDALEAEGQRRDDEHSRAEDDQVGEEVRERLQCPLTAEQVHRHHVQQVEEAYHAEVGGAARAICPMQEAAGADRRRRDDAAGSRQQVASEGVAGQVESHEGEQEPGERSGRGRDDLRGVERPRTVRRPSARGRSRGPGSACTPCRRARRPARALQGGEAAASGR